ncbi:MAG TPA: CDGSH iron-sulfur domain-containing protein [Vicinamibacterales bacterium]|jgi:CDGSH-type Zn-finger protein
MAFIKVRKDGPYLVDVPEEVTLIDWDGKQYEITRRPFALCRCGHSATKPFCDGTHRTIGFKASEGAGPADPTEP